MDAASLFLKGGILWSSQRGRARGLGQLPRCNGGGARRRSKGEAVPHATTWSELSCEAAATCMSLTLFVALLPCLVAHCSVVGMGQKTRSLRPICCVACSGRLGGGVILFRGW